MAITTYAIALGSNRRGRHGAPEREIAAAIEIVGGVVAGSKIVISAPVGPSRRRYANAMILIKTGDTPAELLGRLKLIEASFGRRRGQRWGSRVIDLDIILWSGGAWVSPGLIVPHPAFRKRRFVLAPLRAIAPRWRDPLTGRSVRQLAASVDRPRLAP